jgi:hypothetical protein
MTMKRLTIKGTALALVIFFDLTFTLCVLWGLALPQVHAKGVQILEAIMPGFTWLTPQSYLIGLAWNTVWALYIAVVFVPLFNYFEAGRTVEVRGTGRAPLGEKALPHRP